MIMLRAILCAALALSGIQAEAGLLKISRGRGAIVVPVNTVLPVVTGIAREGDANSCSTGTWANNPLSYQYQWYRDGVTAIGGATASSYVPVTADVTHTVECDVTATNTGGSVAARSLPTAIIAAASEVLASTQTIQFGERTRVGFGGHALGYAGTVYLGITGGTQGCDTKFAFNADKKLVPINGAGADASVGPGYSAASCDVTVAEYSGRSGSFPSYNYSSATGVTGTVTVNIVANAHSVTFRSTDTSTSHELRTVLAMCSAYSTCSASSGTVAADGRSVRLGDAIYLRDGVYATATNTREIFKGTQYAQRAGGPAAPTAYASFSTTAYYGNCSGCNGEGMVQIRPDTDYGATYRLLQPVATATPWYVRFTRTNFERIPAVIAAGSAQNNYSFRSQAGPVNWIQLDNNRFIGRTIDGASVSDSNGASAVYINGAANNFYVYDNEFTDLWMPFRATLTDGDFIGNTVTNQAYDNIGAFIRARIWFNFFQRSFGGSHGDYWQSLENSSATRDGYSFIANIMTGAGGGGAGQGMFNTAAPSPNVPNTIEGGAVKGNIYLDKYLNALRCDYCNNWSIRWNTLLILLDTMAADTPPQIVTSGATNMTVLDNIIAGTKLAGDTTGVDGVNTLEEELIYYDGPFDATLTTKAAVLSALNPKAPAAGLGATGNGVDFIAQTASFPDGTSYVRPREVP